MKRDAHQSSALGDSAAAAFVAACGYRHQQPLDSTSVSLITKRCARVPERRVQALAKGSDAGLRHLVVLIHRASAHSYRADHFAITHQRDAAGEDDDPAAVRGVDAE